MQKIHYLKTWPMYFQKVKDGSKTFEIRKADRDFSVGDILRLEEYLPEAQAYTGDSVDVEVTYTLEGFIHALDGYVVMAIRRIQP